MHVTNGQSGLLHAGGPDSTRQGRGVLAFLMVGILSACSGGSGSTTSGDPPGTSPIVVTVTPASAAISTLQTQRFTATVSNGANAAFVMKVDGIQGGNASVGLISAEGIYSPPPAEGTHTISATSVEAPSKVASAAVVVSFLRGVMTYHNDNARTGQNLRETMLTPANVRPATFGKVFAYVVDGYVYAQPLYVADVPVGNRLRNVLVVATEHNSVYAFDADAQSNTPLWQVSFIDPANGITTVPFQDTASPPGYIGPGPVFPGGCDDLTPEIGITGTPVIDPATGTLYVVAKTRETRGASVAYEHRLHALDIATGTARPGSGQALRASFPGTTLPNDGRGRVLFQSRLQNQRAALLLSNGVVSIAFGSHCIIRPYQGWVLAYDAQTLDPVGAFNVVPNDPKGKGGIWHSGGGPAADASGHVFVMTGDGPFDADSGGDSYSDSVLKLAPGTLGVTDYFTPYNQLVLEVTDADMSSAGPLLLPDQAVGPPHLMVGTGKQGIVYLINRDNMGGSQSGSDSQIVQSFPGSPCAAGWCAFRSTPAYFQNKIYMAAVGDSLRSYALTNGRLAPSGQSPNRFRWPGATPVVSANGAANGIVWALETNGSGASGVLHAYAADNVATELYNSGATPDRDNPGPAIKFSVPTVANGRVYVGSQFRVSVFGLLP